MNGKFVSSSRAQIKTLLVKKRSKSKVLVTQSYPTLCDPMDCSPPGSSVHGILQARTLEWGAVPSSMGYSRPRDQTCVSQVSYAGQEGFFTNSATWEAICVRLVVTPRTIQSIGFYRPEHWSGQPFSSPGDLPNPGIEPRSPELQVDSLPAEPQGKPKNTGVGSLFLLQRIFPTQEWNWGLLHCRRILYQLSYQRSPTYLIMSS